MRNAKPDMRPRPDPGRVFAIGPATFSDDFDRVLVGNGDGSGFASGDLDGGQLPDLRAANVGGKSDSILRNKPLEGD